MTFAPALRPFLERHPTALDVLVLEPQTLWLTDDPFEGPFFEYRPGIELFGSLHGAKLVHSVGMPLGGTRRPDRNQCALLAETAYRLASPWVSEHLSVGGTPHRAAGFLLPPLQTDAGAQTAAQNIRTFQDLVRRPVAVETGVAYLKRKSFEMDDASYLTRVVEDANCGILLDLHNLYCNHRNGRIRLDDYLSRIPLERVWEVHVAGGDLRDGYWLDSHSGPIPEELLSMAKEAVSSLPNLGAINFEMYDTFLERAEMSMLEATVDQMRGLWTAAATGASWETSAVFVPPEDPREEAGAASEGPGNVVQSHPSGSPSAPTPDDWESLMTDAVWRGKPGAQPYDEDQEPLRLYSSLARSFRGSMLVRLLPRTLRYLLLRDQDGVEPLLEEYFAELPPRLYSPLEAMAFARFLEARETKDDLLLALVSYDLAFVQSIRDVTPRTVTFPGDPRPVFEALVEGRLPAMPQPPVWELEIVPDEFSPEDFFSLGGASA